MKSSEWHHEVRQLIRALTRHKVSTNPHAIHTDQQHAHLLWFQKSYTCASYCCALREALYKCIDTIRKLIAFIPLPIVWGVVAHW